MEIFSSTFNLIADFIYFNSNKRPVFCLLATFMAWKCEKRFYALTSICHQFIILSAEMDSDIPILPNRISSDNRSTVK